MFWFEWTMKVPASGFAKKLAIPKNMSKNPPLFKFSRPKTSAKSSGWIVPGQAIERQSKDIN